MAYVMQDDEREAVRTALLGASQRKAYSPMRDLYALMLHVIDNGFALVLTDHEFCLVVGALLYDKNYAAARLMSVRYEDSAQ